MAAHLTNFYLHVVADVVTNVREEFLSEGVDETVLFELQSLWELNMMQAGTIQSCHGDLSYMRNTGHPFPPSTSVHDLNMPYAGETPTAELLFPPTPAQTPTPSFLPSSLEHPDSFDGTDIAIGMPAPFMPSPWVNQKPDINLGMNATLDMNVAYEGGDDEEPSDGRPLVTKEFLPPIGKRKREVSFSSSGSYVPQNDGAGDFMTIPVSLQQALCGDEQAQSSHGTPPRSDMQGCMETTIEGCEHIQERDLPVGDSFHKSLSSSLPQVDGIHDNYDDADAEEDYNEPGVEEQVAAESAELNEPPKAEGGESDTSEPPLGENDDLDDLDDPDVGEGRLQTPHVVYAQFEKVTRAKNKWKCILKDGIMHLNGRDILFSRAMGEFEF